MTKLYLMLLEAIIMGSGDKNLILMKRLAKADSKFFLGAMDAPEYFEAQVYLQLASGVDLLTVSKDHADKTGMTYEEACAVCQRIGKGLGSKPSAAPAKAAQS